jgi:acetolactate synthase-1/2/3 large subunit
MTPFEAIINFLKKEGIEYLSCFPTTNMIETAAKAGIRPIVCRQERVGVGIADGYSRVTNGEKPGVFAMQYGPGAENAYSGVATAFSDSVPVLLLPLGNSEDREGVSPLFSSVVSFASVTKRVERISSSARIGEVMRRTMAALRQGRPGPVMVEIPADILKDQVDPSTLADLSIKHASSQGDPTDIDAAARVLCNSPRPIVHAGQGVLYADASKELTELAELLSLPVMTTVLGKSAFPENHPLSLGSGTEQSIPRKLHHFLRSSDLILGVGCSFTKHGMSMPIPSGKTLIHATNDPTDINKDYQVEYPIIGDAKLVLRQLIDACRDLVGEKGRRNPAVIEEIASIDRLWLADWRRKLTSRERPINPYRVIWEFMQTVDPNDAIVTHDSGNPRMQMMPFYRAGGPRSYIGWGKSHGLGTGLGLIMGAKLARPEKTCVNFMGDAAFGMVGLDFETAVRNRIPIITIVLNNSGMASEGRSMPVADATYRTADLGGNYSEIARAMGGHSERIEDPADIADSIKRALRVSEEQGEPALVEFVTAQETDWSWKGSQSMLGTAAGDFKPS